MITTEYLELNTTGHADMHDITGGVARMIRESGLNAGIVTIFCPSSTSALTTIEYESGALSDLKSSYETASNNSLSNARLLFLLSFDRWFIFSAINSA